MAERDAPPPTPHALDRPVARVAALAVFVLAAAALAFIHREDLFPPEVPTAVSQDPAEACYRARAGDIETMLADGTIDEGQAELFRSRARAYCEAQEGGG